MVSKIAVMALVAVVAVPILLGYGMNFETVQETRFVSDNDPVNVTPLISVGTEYTFVNSNTYELNSNNIWPLGVGLGGAPGYYPNYVKSVTAASSIKLVSRTVTINNGWNDYEDRNVTYFGYYQASFLYNTPPPNSARVNVQFLDANNYIVLNVQYAASFLFDAASKTLSYDSYNSAGQVVGSTISGSVVDSIRWIRYSTMGNDPSGSIATMLFYTDMYSYYPTFTKNIDITGGFRTFGNTLNWGRSGEYYKNILLTADLNSMTDNTLFRFGPVVIFKDLTNSNVLAKWTNLDADPVPIYYDYDNPLNNTYQIELNDQGVSLYYVGPWPNTIGKAPAYHTYHIDIGTWAAPGGYNQLSLYALNSTDMADAYDQPVVFTDMIPTPIVRFDAAQSRGYAIPIIDNATYAPGNFKANPGTVISKIEQYGTSVTFGGNTYAVGRGGTINISGTDIPLEGIRLTSFFNGSEFENEINGIPISTSISPSTITFNGKWSASVSTDSYSQDTHNVTKWVPGHFAWNGIDTDFKMAGLMGSLGTFIALAVYGRRSGARVMPLLLVCGGAALMFLVMI